MHRFLATCLFVFALAPAAWPAAADSPAPNVVVILADDMGYGDLRCYQPESRIPTPHLDRLASQGRRYTDAHTPSAVCSPTRYGLLTGRYAWRTWLKTSVLDGFDPPLIDPERPTLPSLLKAQGYVTAGLGKWHLGMIWTDRGGHPLARRNGGDFRSGTEVDFSRAITGGPWDVGFDGYFGIAGSLDMPPYAFLENRHVVGPMGSAAPEVKTLFLNQAPGAAAQGFELADVLPALTRHAVDFIRSRSGQRKPFFLYLALSSPHLPITPTKEWIGKSGAGLYGDFLMQTDDSVGQVLDAIARTGMAENTLVIFTSDNGGLWHEWAPQEADDIAGYHPTSRGQYNAEHGHHSNAGLRGTKADIYEGGHRVPFIVRWPHHVAAGTTSAALIELNDIFATVADVLGCGLPANAAEDSFSFLGELTGSRQSGPARQFAVHHSIQGVFALREGDWKFVPRRGSGGFSSPSRVTPAVGEATGQLYDLSRDPAEAHNIWGEHPDVVARLQAQLAAIESGSRTRP
jgi:arylsulfatase A